MPRHTSIEGGFDLCYSELSESMRELEHHYMVIKRQNLKLKAAIQQMQATVSEEHEADNARVQTLHKNAIHVLRYTMRDTSNTIDVMRNGMQTRDNAVKRTLIRLLDRLTGGTPAWARSS